MIPSARMAVAAAATLVAFAVVPAPSASAAPAFEAVGGVVRLIAPAVAVAPFPSARVVRALPGGTVAIDVPAGRAAEAWADLTARHGPSRIRPDTRLRLTADHVPADPLWGQMWGARKVGMPAAWGTSLGSPEVVIAILDTGVDAVPDLAGALLPGKDIVDGDDDPSDSDGHGTAVAQVAAARIDDGIGGAGVCPRCSILPVRVGTKAGAWSSDSSAGLVWAADHGATVANMSYGSEGGAGLDDAAVRYARAAGVSVVAAAGNGGDTAPMYPASSPGVVSVAGSDEKDAIASWSTRGTWVDIAAPGWAVIPADGGGWWELQGTSYAAPMVAGALALLASAAPTSTMAEREAAVVSSGAPVSPAGAVGGGRLDVPAALAALGAKVAPPSPAVPGAPVIAITAPSRGVTYTRAAAATVAWTETLLAGETVSSRTVTQESTPVEAGTCASGSWAPDGDPQPADPGTFTSGTLADGTCYRWRIDVADGSGRTASATTRTVFVDRSKPAIRAVVPKKLTRISKRDFSFRWAIADGTAGSGVSRDLTIVTYEGRPSGSRCVGWRTWKTRKVPAGTVEDAYWATGPVCIRIRITAVDAAGNATTTMLPAYLHR